MKTTSRILLAAAVAAAFTLKADVRGSESVNTADVPTNRVLTAGPRYLEEHPEVQRTPASVEESEDGAAQSRKRLVKRMENRARASGPRVQNMFPELKRGRIFARGTCGASN